MTGSARPLPAPAEAVRVDDGRAQHLVQDLRVRADVDEAGPGDLDLCDARIVLEVGDEQLGQGARVHARFLGQHHGGVRGEIAMGGIARRLDHDAADIEPRGNLARLGQPAERIRNPLLEQPENVHGTLISEGPLGPGIPWRA